MCREEDVLQRCILKICCKKVVGAWGVGTYHNPLKKYVVQETQKELLHIIVLFETNKWQKHTLSPSIIQFDLELHYGNKHSTPTLLTLTHIHTQQQ